MRRDVSLSRGLLGSLLLLAGLAGVAEAIDQKDAEELVTRVGRARWTEHNTVELLADPRRAWEARVDLAEAARHHLLISVFSWHNDQYGKRYRRILRARLKERKREGAEFTVRVLADASALTSFSTAFRALEKDGAKVRGFNRSSWGLTALYDGRMHDKIIVSDGLEAIVGGRNFSDDYFEPQHWWFDLGVRLEGPAVDDLQMIFFKSWEFTEFNRKMGRFLLPQEMLLEDLRVFWRTGRYPNGSSPMAKFMTPEFFPRREVIPGGLKVAVLYDNPLLRRRAASTDVVIALVDHAEEHIDLMSPFPNFPNDLTESLVAAVERGVTVRLLVNDREAAIRGGPFLLAAYPALIRLIEAGAEVWAWRANKDVIAQISESECRPTLMPPIAIHGKMLRVDDEISIIHSSNFNIRSTYYNTEAGVAVLGHFFNSKLGDLVDELIALKDFELDCSNGDHGPEVPALLGQLTREDVPLMREELGGKQKFLDAWSVAW
jgi:phosphatidylserine/phosphatidylglycerophosphate/cardiolipin synthase-like enzyme